MNSAQPQHIPTDFTPWEACAILDALDSRRVPYAAPNGRFTFKKNGEALPEDFAWSIALRQDDLSELVGAMMDDRATCPKCKGVVRGKRIDLLKLGKWASYHPACMDPYLNSRYIEEHPSDDPDIRVFHYVARQTAATFAPTCRTEGCGGRPSSQSEPPDGPFDLCRRCADKRGERRVPLEELLARAQAMAEEHYRRLTSIAGSSVDPVGETAYSR